MSIAGIVLGMTGVLATTAAWTYFLSTYTPLPEPLVSSPKISPEGTRYLRNRAAVLSDFAQGVSQGRLQKGRMISLSSTTGGRKDSIDVCDLEGLETSPGFRIRIEASTNRQGKAAASGIRGNLLLVSKGSTAPPLPIAALRSYRDSKLRELIGQSIFPWQIPTAYAAEAPQLVYGTADPPGGRIIIEGSQVTLYDASGKALGRYTFTGLDLFGHSLRVLGRWPSTPGRAGAYPGTTLPYTWVIYKRSQPENNDPLAHLADP